MQHSKFSFSGSHIWMEDKCPASIRMSQGFDNPSNPAAAKGTAAHALGEFSAKLGVNIRDCLGLTFEGHKVDHKMIDDVSLYTGYISDKTIGYGVKPELEQKVVMTSLGRNDVYGTSDCTFVSLEERSIDVIDYKNGYGMVDVKKNSQTIGYSIATLDTFNLWGSIDTIVNTIVQPNANHVDGPIRQELYTIDDMKYWLEKYRRSVSLAENKNTRPNAGKHCHWCLAQSNCRARVDYVLDVAYTNVPFDELSIGELEIIYNNISSIKSFCDKVEKRIFGEAQKGRKFEDVKLVKSYGRASVKNEEALIVDAENEGLERDDLFNLKLKSKTDLKRILPHSIVNKHFVSPEPGTKLVEMSNNSPAIRVNSVKGVFDAFKINKPKPVNGAFDNYKIIK